MWRNCVREAVTKPVKNWCGEPEHAEDRKKRVEKAWRHQRAEMRDCANENGAMKKFIMENHLEDFKAYRSEQILKGEQDPGDIANYGLYLVRGPGQWEFDIWPYRDPLHL